jgi:hypothetical protein
MLPFNILKSLRSILQASSLYNHHQKTHQETYSRTRSAEAKPRCTTVAPTLKQVEPALAHRRCRSRARVGNWEPIVKKPGCHVPIIENTPRIMSEQKERKKHMQGSEEISDKEGKGSVDQGGGVVPHPVSFGCYLID